MTTEVDKFFEGLPSQDKKLADVFEAPKTPEQGEKLEDKPKDDDESEIRKNRRHRRLEEQLQKERESNIALAERIKVLAEVDKTIKESDGAIDPRLIRVFGTTDEAKEIARHFTEILNETKESARKETLEEIESKQAELVKEQQNYESQIDSELEALEEEHDIDLTSNAPAARKTRKEFLELVQSLSPKDVDGSITGYADFGSTFDLYQRTKEEAKNDNSRNKEVASKSMQRSAVGKSGEAPITPGFRGWEKDYNINN